MNITTPESSAPKKVKTQATPLSNQDEAKSWADHWRKLQQEAPTRHEDAAKFLATIISLSLTLFTALGKTIGLEKIPTATGLIIWLLALISAFLTLLPFPIQADENSKDRKEALRKVTHRKRFLLLAAISIYLIGMIIILTAYIID